MNIYNNKKTTKYFVRIFTFLIIIISYSCDNSQKNGYLIDLKKSEPISIKDQFLNISLIPLETSDEGLIGQLLKVIQFDDKYFILDGKQKSILTFDKSGEFLFKIDNKGKGPGEYTDISDFEINPYSKNIEILSPWGAIYVYSINGKFLDSYKIPKPIKVVHFFKFISEHSILLYCMTEENRIFVYNRKSGEIVEKDYKVPEHILTNIFTTFFPMYMVNQKIHIRENFSNNVYMFNNNNIAIKYSWNFEKLNIDLKEVPSSKKLKKEYIEWFTNGGHKQFVYPFYMNLENKNQVFTIFGYDEKFNHLVFNKETKNYKLFDKYKEGVTFPYYFVSTIDDEEYISAVEPSMISNFVKPEFLDDKNNQILREISIEDNPVIIKYQLNPTFKDKK